MNPVIENDILHVSRVMRTSIVQCAPRLHLVDYWHVRLASLLDTPGMNELQRRTVMGLRRELVDIDAWLRTLRDGAGYTLDCTTDPYRHTGDLRLLRSSDS
jgi:hypothetical protein